MSMDTPSRLGPLLLGLCALALPLGMAAALGFDGLYGQDSYAYAGYAQDLRLWLGGGPKPEAIFWPEIYPLLAALLSFLTSDVALACQLLSAIALGLAAYWLARSGQVLALPPDATWTAGLLLASSPYLLRNGTMCMSDALALAWVAGTIRFLLAYRSSGRSRQLFGCAVLACLAILTRYAAFVIVLPLLLAAFARAWAMRDAKGLGMALISAGLLAALHLHLQGLGNAGHHFLSQWQAAHLFQNTFDMQDGHFEFALPNFAFNLGLFYHPGFLGAGLFLLPIWLLLWLRGSRPLLLILGTLFLYLLFLSGIPFQNARFLLLGLPLLWVLLLRPLGSAAAWLRLQKGIFPLLLVAALLGNMALAWRATEPFAAQSRLEGQIAEAVDRREGAAVYTFGLEGALAWRAPGTVVHSLYAELQAQPQPGDLAVFNEAAFAEQWRGKLPMVNWESLKVWYILNEVKDFGAGWKLYEVR